MNDSPDQAAGSPRSGASGDAPRTVPDLGLEPRYAYAEVPPHALGWWSEPDGTEPPPAAQRGVESDADPECALRLPMVPFDERLRVPLPAKTVWPIDGAPFALSSKEELFGRYLGPYLAPYLSPYQLVVLHEYLATIGPHGPSYDDLNPGAPMQWLVAWHTFGLGGDHAVRPTLAWVARVLSVVWWSAQPRIDLKPEHYDAVDGVLPDDERLLRLCRGGAVVGGGNLHAMICLAWYAVVDLSRRLLPALRGCPERLPRDESGFGFDARLRDALAGVGAVPAHPLSEWSQRREALSSPYPAALWGQRYPIQLAQAQVATFGALSALASGQSRDRRKVPSAVTGTVRRAQWDDLLRRNIYVYSDFSLRALGSAVLALRLVLHVAYRALVYFGYGDTWDPRDPPHAYCSVLECLRDAPVHRMHVMFAEFAERCALSRPVLWALEADLYRTAGHLAPFALERYWGVPADRPDSHERAGAFCPAGAYYIRIPLVPPSQIART